MTRQYTLKTDDLSLSFIIRAFSNVMIVDTDGDTLVHTFQNKEKIECTEKLLKKFTIVEIVAGNDMLIIYVEA